MRNTNLIIAIKILKSLKLASKIINRLFKIIKVKNILPDKHAEKYAFFRLLLAKKVKHVIFPFDEKQVKTSY